jgi:hypothetical protein
MSIAGDIAVRTAAAGVRTGQLDVAEGTRPTDLAWRQGTPAAVAALVVALAAEVASSRTPFDLAVEAEERQDTPVAPPSPAQSPAGENREVAAAAEAPAAAPRTPFAARIQLGAVVGGMTAAAAVADSRVVAADRHPSRWGEAALFAPGRHPSCQRPTSRILPPPNRPPTFRSALQWGGCCCPLDGRSDRRGSVPNPRSGRLEIRTREKM